MSIRFERNDFEHIGHENGRSPEICITQNKYFNGLQLIYFSRCLKFIFDKNVLPVCFLSCILRSAALEYLASQPSIAWQT